MSFTWHFYTGETPIVPIGRKCHRGPMIRVETVLARPFKLLVPYETLRVRLLDHIVGSELAAVRTREVVLRTLFSTLGPIFARMRGQKEALDVRICEKKNSLVIFDELSDLLPFYMNGARGLQQYGVPTQQIDLLLGAMNSANAVQKVAGICATMLLAAFIEMDQYDG